MECGNGTQSRDKMCGSVVCGGLVGSCNLKPCDGTYSETEMGLSLFDVKYCTRYMRDKQYMYQMVACWRQCSNNNQESIQSRT